MKRTMLWSDLLPYARGSAGPYSSFERTFLAHLQPLPWDKEFHEASPVVLLASAIQQEVVRWPRGGLSNKAMLALVRGVFMGVQLLADFDNIVWQVLVDGQAWPGFDRIIGPFGVPVYPKPTLIPLLPDQVVQIVATNLTAANIVNVTAGVEGHYFPALLDSSEPGAGG